MMTVFAIMSRPHAITAVTALHVAYTVLLAALTVYCVVLAHHAAGSHKQEAGTASGLLMGAVCLGVFAALYAISSLGLWRVRRWGWIVALVMNALIPFFVLWDMLIDRDRDPDNWIALGIFGVPIVLLLLPAVRRPFFPKRNAAAA